MPKTIRNKYHECLSFENLLSAHKKARRGKREKRQIIVVELSLEQILFDLENDLRDRKYIHGNYNTFRIYAPKEREIKASHYKDRIVHEWYVENFIIPYFVPQFIETSYACIMGRGMHKASSDVQDAMRKCSKNWNGNYYILKMDVSKYFYNIDKKILFEILKRKIKDKDILWLTKQILLSTEGRYGLPLGNYTSQMYANIYLNELDQYAKHTLKCKYYYRYMDDVVIMCETKTKAKEWLSNISGFLQNELGLMLNSKTNIFKNSQGVNFCGYKINEFRMKIRHTSKVRMKRKFKKMVKLYKSGKIIWKDISRSLAGWIGYAKHANTYNLFCKCGVFYIEG